MIAGCPPVCTEFTRLGVVACPQVPVQCPVGRTPEKLPPTVCMDLLRTYIAGSLDKGPHDLLVEIPRVGQDSAFMTRLRRNIPRTEHITVDRLPTDLPHSLLPVPRGALP